MKFLTRTVAALALVAGFAGLASSADAQVIIRRPGVGVIIGAPVIVPPPVIVAPPVVVAPRVYYYVRILPGQALPYGCGVPQVYSRDPNNGAQLMARDPQTGALYPTQAQFARCYR
jgi:hypothetical protein